MSNSSFRSEREAIVTLRKAYPNEGPRKLANRIVSRSHFVGSELKLCEQVSGRPVLSVYGVIRRHDAKGYYADGGETKAAQWRSNNRKRALVVA